MPGQTTAGADESSRSDAWRARMANTLTLLRQDGEHTYIVAPDPVIFASQIFRSSLFLDDTLVEHQGELFLESLACVVTGGTNGE